LIDEIHSPRSPLLVRKVIVKDVYCIKPNASHSKTRCKMPTCACGLPVYCNGVFAILLATIRISIRAATSQVRRRRQGTDRHPLVGEHPRFSTGPPSTIKALGVLTLLARTSCNKDCILIAMSAGGVWRICEINGQTP